MIGGLFEICAVPVEDEWAGQWTPEDEEDFFPGLTKGSRLTTEQLDPLFAEEC